MRWAHDLRPTLLLIGRGEPMEAALRVALDRHGMQVESAPTNAAVEAVTASAPDLVVLTGDSVVDGGAPVLRLLADNPVTSVVPVALLLDDSSLDQRLRAFRSGAVAVIRRGASADAVAQKVAQLARELPERQGAQTGELGEATLAELVELVSSELRSGILSVHPHSGAKKGDPIRVVLGAGGPVAEALAAFVEQLRPLIAQAEPLRYELLEESGGRLRLFAGEEDAAGDLSIMKDLRVLIMDNDPGRADVLAQALRDHGSLVGVTDVTVRGLDRARNLDPELVILDSTAIEGSGFEAVRSLRRDPQLRWASLLVARWDELWPEDRAAPDLEQLAGRIAPLTEHDRTLRDRATGEEPFDTRLELTGPSRLLRTLARLTGTRHVSVRSPRATVDIDIADGLIAGGSGTSHGDEPRPIVGMVALAALLNLSAGRVRIERRGHPSAANIMLPVDEAIVRAAQEESPVKPSVLPPAKNLGGVPVPIVRAVAGRAGQAPHRLEPADPLRSGRASRTRDPFPPAERLRADRASAGFDSTDSTEEALVDQRSNDSGPISPSQLHPPGTATSLEGSSEPARKSDLRWDDTATEAPPPANTGDRGDPTTPFNVPSETDAIAPPGRARPPAERYVPPRPPAARPPQSSGGVPRPQPPGSPRAAASASAWKPTAPPSAAKATAAPPAGRRPAATVPMPVAAGGPRQTGTPTAVPPVAARSSAGVAAPEQPSHARKRTIVGMAPPLADAGTYGPTSRLPAEAVGKGDHAAGRRRSPTLLGAGLPAASMQVAERQAMATSRPPELAEAEPARRLSGDHVHPGRRTMSGLGESVSDLELGSGLLDFDDFLLEESVSAPFPAPPDNPLESESGLNEASLFGDLDAIPELEPADPAGAELHPAVAPLPPRPAAVAPPPLPMAPELDVSAPMDGGHSEQAEPSLYAGSPAAPGQSGGVVPGADAPMATRRDLVDPTIPEPLARDSTDLSDPELRPAGSLPTASATDSMPALPRPRRSAARRLGYIAAGMVAAAFIGGGAALLTRQRPSEVNLEPSREATHAALEPTRARSAVGGAEAAPAAPEPNAPAAAAGASAGAEDAPSNGAPEAAPADAPDAPSSGAPEAAPADAPVAVADAPVSPSSELAAAAPHAPADAPSFTPDAQLPRDRARAADLLVDEALVLIEAGHLEVAERAMDRSMELDPRNPQGFEGLARLRLAQGDFERAIEAAEQAVNVRRRRSEYYVLLGDVLVAAGRVEDARGAFIRGLRVDSGNRELRERLSALPTP